MSFLVETDIVGMLRHLAGALQAFAKANRIALTFRSDCKKLVVPHYPEEVIGEVTGLICRVIEYTPPGQALLLGITSVGALARTAPQVTLTATGIDLSRISQITAPCRQEVRISYSGAQGTSYEWCCPAGPQGSPAATPNADQSSPGLRHLPNFYANVRKHLQSYFAKTDNLLAALPTHHPKDAIFIKKIHKAILDNIGRQGFDANHLSEFMRMSRTQLYRRLQQIVREAPGSYIKKIRMQKAKELLETTDMRVGEVAYKTGFQTPSHFTRTFIQHYGVKPSLFCRRNKNATDR